ncbi:sigma-70 family RNA polymerase sigma factor [bacterium]|nr:sigma-70 family RNA polymerase sigma factor [bacterium]
MQRDNKNVDLNKQISEWLDVYHSETVGVVKKQRVKSLIVENMLPIVRNIAKKIARRTTDPIDDMVQAGSIGLLKAIERYSKEKNDNFKVYAGYWIIGEMKHYLRDKLNTIRVPRHIQELCIRVSNFTNSLTMEELQVLTSDDVASALDVPTKTVDLAMMADRRTSTISLEDVYSMDDSSGLSFEEMIPVKDYKEAANIEDAKIIFDNIIDKLPPDEKVVMDMYYKQDMSKKEIAEALLLTQMSVTRRFKNAFNIISDIVIEKKVQGANGLIS